MNKKLVPVLAVLAVLGLGGYYLKNKQSDPGAPQTVGQTMNEAEEFARAIESGRPTLCTMTRAEDKMEYFIKGKKIYVNMHNIIENKTVVSHMINDEKYLYMWTDGQTQGSKIDLLASPLPVTSPTSRPDTPQFDSATDFDSYKAEGYTINCQASNITDSAFIPPREINFIDPTEIMRQLTPQGANGQLDMSQLQGLQDDYGEEEMEFDNP